MMTKELNVAITQLVLWYDSTRIQTWPSMLAKASANEVYRSTRAFGSEFYTDRKTKSGHSAADNTTKNLPGLEQKKDTLLLRGVGFLEKVKGGYKLSESGNELATAYRDAPKGADWVVLLGKALLTREPRTRVFMKLLSSEDAVLYFADDEWWGGSIQRATVSTGMGEDYQPFNDSETSSHLRDALNQKPNWALGDWREHKEFCETDKTVFVGQTSQNYSLHAISTALRAACEVFLHLGVICSQSERAWLDQGKAITSFGTAIANDFGWDHQPEEPQDLFSQIAKLVSQLKSESGFLVVSELRTKLEELGIENPDSQIANLESAGRIEIVETDFGHGRHGSGLYGDQSKQLIKIRLN